MELSGKWVFKYDPTLNGAEDATFTGDFTIGGVNYVQIEWMGVQLYAYTTPDANPDTIFDIGGGGDPIWNNGTYPECATILFNTPLTLTDAQYTFWMNRLDYSIATNINVKILNNDGTINASGSFPLPTEFINIFPERHRRYTLEGYNEDATLSGSLVFTIPEEGVDNVGLCAVPNGDILYQTGQTHVEWDTDQEFYVRAYTPADVVVHDRTGAVLGHVLNYDDEFIQSLSVIDLGDGMGCCWVNGRSSLAFSFRYAPQGNETTVFLGFSTSVNGALVYGIGSHVLQPELSGTVNLYIKTEERPVVGNNNLTLYNCTAERIRADKNAYLSDAVNLVGTCRGDCSIIDPVIIIDTTKDVINSHNYCYFDQTKRYYFIQNVVAINSKLYELHLHADALMNWRKAMRNSTGYCTRNEFAFNQFYADARNPRDVIKEKKIFDATMRTQFSPFVQIAVVTTYGTGR